MKIIFYSIIIILLTIPDYVNAQCCGSKQLMNQHITASPFQIYYGRYEGNPFLNNEWGTALLTVVSGETYSNLKLKYDIYRNNFIYYNSRLSKMLIIDNNIINNVVLVDNSNSGEARFVRYCKNEKSCSFYEVHYTDSISFWTEHRKKIENYNDISRSNSYLGGFYLASKNVLKINDEFSSLPKSKRALVNLFPTNKKFLVSFINKNGLKVKAKEDLIKIFAKINELEKANPSVYLEYPTWMFWK